MALIGLVNSYAQVNICDTYADMSKWTNSSIYQNDTLYATGNEDNKRMYMTVGMLSNIWQAQIDFTPVARSFAGPCLTLLAVTAGTKDWNYDGPYSTSNTMFSDQDGIAIVWNSDLNSSKSYLSVCIKDGRNRTVQNVAEGLINENVNYVVKFNRLSATTGKLTVTSGGVNIPGSPFTIDGILSSVIGLNTIQQGTTLGASSYRYCSAVVSNFSLLTNIPVNNSLLAPVVSNSMEVCQYSNITLGTYTPNVNSKYSWFVQNNTVPITFSKVSKLQIFKTLAFNTQKYFASYNTCGWISPMAEVLVTVNPTPSPVGQIMGSSVVNINQEINLTTTSVGGFWSSSNNNIVTVNSSGVVKGVAKGFANIYYKLFLGNCSSIATKQIEVK